MAMAAPSIVMAPLLCATTSACAALIAGMSAALSVWATAVDGDDVSSTAAAAAANAAAAAGAELQSRALAAAAAMAMVGKDGAALLSAAAAAAIAAGESIAAADLAAVTASQLILQFRTVKGSAAPAEKPRVVSALDVQCNSKGMPFEVCAQHTASSEDSCS